MSSESSVFQRTEGGQTDLLDVPGCKTLIMYAAVVGQSPLQTDRDRKIRFAVFIISNINILLPSLGKSVLDNDPDGMMDCVPLILALIVCMMKLDNHNKNREKYKQFFKFVHGEWEALKFSNETSVLNKVASQGSHLALLYRRTLLLLLVLFLLIPLTPIFLDVVLPLNGTRPRRNISLVIIAIAIDSVYMVGVYQICGFLATCGYQIKQATERASGTVDLYQHFKQFAISHNKAIQFYELIGSCNRNSYLLQVGLNMIGISVTAVQILVHLGKPGEFHRIAMFICQKFHLLVLSLPGQALVDYSLGLANDIYASKWYETSVKIQKLLYIMKMKSSKACIITAGGLYQMNIENFGMIIKSCMSYFMMLTSLRE